MLVVAFFAVIFVSLVQASIPGCPPVEELEESAAINLDDLLLCFCKERDEERNEVDVSCLYGSSLEHLAKASSFVAATNKSVTSVSMTHVGLALLEDDQFSAMPHLRELSISDCVAGELRVSDHAFRGLTQLSTLRINSCDLKEMSVALEETPNLEVLSLARNKLQHIDNRLFSNKKFLKYLDLSGNFLSSVPDGTFNGIDQLETLAIGEHNYLNDSLLNEIAKLTQLMELDLSRADGVFEFPKELSALIKLKTLKLSGCSLTSLDELEFQGLENLEMLDLRVNLIENISANAFAANPHLQRISLAGNFIRSVDGKAWSGLDSLEDLDLGWNELQSVSASSFGPITSSLRILGLAHNKKLREIVFKEAFKSLKILDLTETNVSSIGPETFQGLLELESLDFSRSNLSSIHHKALAPLGGSLKRLLLGETKLTSLPRELLQELPKLETFDISNNKFVCDSSLGALVELINERFKERAESEMDFEIVNANDTLCDRPVSLRGSAVFDLPSSAFKDFDLTSDTTTAKATIETTQVSLLPSTSSQTTTEEATTTFTIPDLFVGEDKNETILVFPEEPRERYDISHLDGPPKEETEASTGVKTKVALGVVGLLSVIIIGAVTVYIKVTVSKHTWIPLVQNKRKATAVQPEKTSTKGEDGMVEIELGGSLKRNHANSNT